MDRKAILDIAFGILTVGYFIFAVIYGADDLYTASQRSLFEAFVVTTKYFAPLVLLALVRPVVNTLMQSRPKSG